MKVVTGIGGVFFRAKDPAVLSEWYKDVLGIDSLEQVWTQASGPTIIAPFSEGSDYFGSPDQQWMINFRVSDLDAVMEHLRGKGIEVITKPDWNSEAGRFARIHDPEGNPIELWEPVEDPA